jgi:PPOX class probable F420-dependent enzyme
MTPAERRAFVGDHRTAIFGYNRVSDGPAMSIVYYVLDTDETILVSTMRDRAKARAVARNPNVSMCVLDEQWPPTYLQVYCRAEIDVDEERTVDLMMAIAGVMAGKPLDASLRPLVLQGAKQENRVVLRLRPYATFETPPRHVHDESDINPSLTHWTSTSLPWRDDGGPLAT